MVMVVDVVIVKGMIVVDGNKLIDVVIVEVDVKLYWFWLGYCFDVDIENLVSDDWVFLLIVFWYFVKWNLNGCVGWNFLVYMD